MAQAVVDAELDARERRKEAQETQARWLVVTAGVLLTLSLGFARETGALVPGSSWLPRTLLVITLVLDSAAVFAGLMALRPRAYERMSGAGLEMYNDETVLDGPADPLVGRVNATRIGMIKSFDAHHDDKARWVAGSAALLLAGLLAVAAQGAVLAVDPPDPAAPTSRVDSP